MFTPVRQPLHYSRMLLSCVAGSYPSATSSGMSFLSAGCLWRAHASYCPLY